MNELLKVKGIGETTLQKLFDMGINDCTELVQFFPSKYVIQHIDLLEDRFYKQELTLVGKILKKPKIYYIRRKLTKLTISVSVMDQEFNVSIFNREFLAGTLFVGEDIVFSGKFQSKNDFVAHDVVKKKNYIEGIIPVYPLKDLSSKNFSKWVRAILDQKDFSIEETIPYSLIQKRLLKTSKEVYPLIHFPRQLEDITLATNRIKYEELLDFFLRLSLMKQLRQQVPLSKKKYDISKVKEWIASLPFELTDDQKEATNDIFKDFKSPYAMNRLLQGDVGSGKTVVAFIAAYAIITTGDQVALMSPTEILAMQHYQTVLSLFSGFPVRAAFISSSVSVKERARIMNELKTHQIDIIVGTHSLIQQDISFDSLGLVIIDEQHRFGVEQRKTMREKGWHPEVLMMSATPIPRTLAITLFNDMDISSIHQMPSGRKPVKTDIIPYENLDQGLLLLLSELKAGHQAYVITPLIEVNEDSISISVREAYEIIKESLPDKYNIEILHGKMKNAEKEEVLSRFYQNKTQVLVSTTVVEVGVNVPNATYMMVFNASGFGLSQLHQLRGRVGRSEAQAYCHFISDKPLEEEQRLAVLKETTDGFVISEADLSFRGPGEIFGYLQTGIPKFRMVNFMTDQPLIEQVIEDTNELLSLNDAITRKKINKIKKNIDTYQID